MSCYVPSLRTYYSFCIKYGNETTLNYSWQAGYVIIVPCLLHLKRKDHVRHPVCLLRKMFRTRVTFIHVTWKTNLIQQLVHILLYKSFTEFVCYRKLERFIVSYTYANIVRMFWVTAVEFSLWILCPHFVAFQTTLYYLVSVTVVLCEPVELMFIIQFFIPLTGSVFNSYYVKFQTMY